MQLLAVAGDRNGSIQVLSSEGLLRTSGGQLLFPGKLVRDLAYLPLVKKKISAVGVYRDQLVYLDDKAVFSNAWAGSLYSRHGMSDARFFCGGNDFRFLVSDGHALRYLHGDSVVWEGKTEEGIRDLYFDAASGVFRMLGAHSVSVYSPASGLVQRAYTSDDELTCFAPGEKAGQLVLGTHNGYSVIDAGTGKPVQALRRDLPATDITVMRRIGGRLWFGSGAGAFMLRPDGGFDYYASRRWLPSDEVKDIAAGIGGQVVVLTGKGLGVLHFDAMTLADKAQFYERQVRARHIRVGFNSTISRMQVEGDVTTGSLEDSDNDGLWTSMYLGAEAFRYAATHSPEALQNCRESIDAMERLFTVNGIEGFPSRSYERRGFEQADTMVWKRAKDVEWDWKSTTSSDEAIGHMFVYGVIAELVDDAALKAKAIHLMDLLMTHIVTHNLYLVDWNGEPTLWGRWNPEYVNARPPMVGDRKLTSSNIISMLQTAWHFTHKPMFRDKALELMNRYGYLDNLTRPVKSIGPAPATADDLSKRLSDGWNHSDDEMYFLGYWGLYRYALNDTLRVRYRAAILDHWEAERPEKEGAWNLFTAVTGVSNFDLSEAIWYLQRYPLDQVEWRVHNSDRKDIVRIPKNFRNQTIENVLPPDESPIHRHNANRFALDGGGDGRGEASAGDSWLLPYWLGRYLGVISDPENQIH
jgi:hypothetical protein